MMRFLRLSSIWLCIVLIAGCSSAYKSLKKVECPPTLGSNLCTLPDTRPRFEKAYYRSYVNGGFLFKKYHLSGILLMKAVSNGQRVVFANEMGYVFFDFGWYASSPSSNSRIAVYDSFVVHSIMPRLNKQAVIKTFRKDIELAMGDVSNRGRYNKGDTAYYRVATQAGGLAWFIFSPSYDLKRIEIANRRRPLTTVYKHPYSLAGELRMFDTLSVIHHKAHFTIQAYRFMPPNNSESNDE